MGNPDCGRIHIPCSWFPHSNTLSVECWVSVISLGTCSLFCAKALYRTGCSLNVIPCRVGLVVSVYASHTVGREFACRPGHTKDHHKNGTYCLPARHAMARNALGLEFGSAARLSKRPGTVVCRTVYGDMHVFDFDL